MSERPPRGRPLAKRTLYRLEQEKVQAPPSLSSRLLQSRMGRTGLASALLVTGGAVVAYEQSTEQSAPIAETAVVRSVFRTGGDGVWLHDGPGIEAPAQVVIPEGGQFAIDCFTVGEAVSGNPVWLHGDYNGQVGDVTDYYVDTQWNTTQELVDQGIEECGSVQPEPQPAPQEQQPEQENCYFNFKWPKKNLTFSYEGEHRYYGNAWQAAKNWSDLGIVSIEPAPEGEQGDIVVEDVSVQSDEDRRWLGKAVFSDSLISNPKLIQQDPESMDSMQLLANKYYLEAASDYQRTYTFTHEFGHILGFAHIDDDKCGLSKNDIEKQDTMMKSGQYTDMNNLTFNTPREHDVAMLRYLYGS